MSSITKPRRMLPAAMIAALAAGAGTAVLASGAGQEPMITLGDNPGKVLKIYGSELGDTITYGGYTQGVTVLGDRVITSERHDCEVTPGPMTNAFCSRDQGSYATLDTGLAGGRDELRFYKSFDPEGLRIIGGGGNGGDSLWGTHKRDKLRGGHGGDQLLGLEGDDDLDGGAGIDVCDGGPGHDTRSNCEQ